MHSPGGRPVHAPALPRSQDDCQEQGRSSQCSLRPAPASRAHASPSCVLLSYCQGHSGWVRVKEDIGPRLKCPLDQTGETQPLLFGCGGSVQLTCVCSRHGGRQGRASLEPGVGGVAGVEDGRRRGVRAASQAVTPPLSSAPGRKGTGLFLPRGIPGLGWAFAQRASSLLLPGAIKAPAGVVGAGRGAEAPSIPTGVGVAGPWWLSSYLPGASPWPG